MEQKPIEINIYDDIDFKADVVDQKPLPSAPKRLQIDFYTHALW